MNRPRANSFKNWRAVLRACYLSGYLIARLPAKT